MRWGEKRVTVLILNKQEQRSGCENVDDTVCVGLAGLFVIDERGRAGGCARRWRRSKTERGRREEKRDREKYGDRGWERE